MQRAKALYYSEIGNFVETRSASPIFLWANIYSSYVARYGRYNRQSLSAELLIKNLISGNLNLATTDTYLRIATHWAASNDARTDCSWPAHLKTTSTPTPLVSSWIVSSGRHGPETGHKRIYMAGSQFIDVVEQKDPDHYEQIGHIATAFQAKTAILVPQLKRYYLAVPHHEKQSAELREYDVVQ